MFFVVAGKYLKKPRLAAVIESSVEVGHDSDINIAAADAEDNDQSDEENSGFTENSVYVGSGMLDGELSPVVCTLKRKNTNSEYEPLPVIVKKKKKVRDFSDVILIFMAKTPPFCTKCSFPFNIFSMRRNHWNRNRFYPKFFKKNSHISGTSSILTYTVFN